MGRITCLPKLFEKVFCFFKLVPYMYICAMQRAFREVVSFRVCSLKSWGVYADYMTYRVIYKHEI